MIMIMCVTYLRSLDVFDKSLGYIIFYIQRFFYMVLFYVYAEFTTFKLSSLDSCYSKALGILSVRAYNYLQAAEVIL